MGIGFVISLEFSDSSSPRLCNVLRKDRIDESGSDAPKWRSARIRTSSIGVLPSSWPAMNPSASRKRKKRLDLESLTMKPPASVESLRLRIRSRRSCGHASSTRALVIETVGINVKRRPPQCDGLVFTSPAYPVPFCDQPCGPTSQISRLGCPAGLHSPSVRSKYRCCYCYCYCC